MNNNELDVNFSEMSDEDLVAFKSQLETAYERLCEDRAKELKQIDGKSFDPFTFFGKKKIEKVVQKYSKFDDGYSFLMEELLKEFERRQISASEVELASLSKLSDEDYIAVQINKNKEFQSRKNIDKE